MNDEERRSRVNVIRALYEAHEQRDIDRALTFLAEDVAWPNVAEGRTLHGHAAARRYWTDQFDVIDPHVTPTHIDAEGEHVVVHVHQVVNDMKGTVLHESDVEHVFTFEGDRIKAMEVRQPG